MTRPSAEESRELKTLVLVTGPSVGEPRFGAGRRGCHCHNGTPPATRMTRPADKNRSVLAASSRAPCRRSSAVRWPCDAFCVRQRGGVGVVHALRAELRDRDLEERGQLLRVLREAPDPAVGVVQDHELPAGGSPCHSRLSKAERTAPLLPRTPGARGRASSWRSGVTASADSSRSQAAPPRCPGLRLPRDGRRLGHRVGRDREQGVECLDVSPRPQVKILEVEAESSVYPITSLTCGNVGSQGFR